MRTICLALTNRQYGKAAPHHDRARAHFAERGLDVLWYYGIDGARLGVDASYAFAQPGDTTRPPTIGPMPVGCFLSHRAAWAAVAMMADEPTMFLESDAWFPPDWRLRFDRALADVERGDPAWELLFPGSCCCKGLPQRQLVGEVFSVEGGPQCLHTYVVRSYAALMKLCEQVDALGCHEPIDALLARRVLPSMRSYTVLPRIVTQADPPPGLEALPD